MGVYAGDSQVALEFQRSGMSACGCSDLQPEDQPLSCSGMEAVHGSFLAVGCFNGIHCITDSPHTYICVLSTTSSDGTLYESCKNLAGSQMNTDLLTACHLLATAPGKAAPDHRYATCFQL